MSNKIFIVSEYVDGAQNSTGYYWSKIISAISGNEKEVNIISSKKSIFIAKKSLQKKNLNFFYVKDHKNNKTNSLKRAFNDIVFSVRISLKVLFMSKKNDIVMTGTNPAFLFFFLSAIKLLKRFKLIVLIHDIFPENLIPSKIIKSKYFIVLKPLIFLFNIAYSNCNSLIVIGRDMRELISKKIYSKNVDIKYIPNFVDFNDLKIYETSEATEKKITLNFFGNLGRVQGIDTLLEAILIVNNENIKFNFIGNGIAEKLIETFIENNPTINVNLFKDLLFEDKNKMLNRGDIAIISLSKGMRGLAVPSKTYFSLAANKPLLVIADKDSELEMLLKEHPNIGWFCIAGQPKKIAKQINQIYKSGIDKKNSKPYLTAKNFYEYSKIKQQFIDLIDEI